jgi:NhaP-type Na+/H+ or K+/H+ antiporter
METYLIFFTAVFALGITAQWLAFRFQFPSILALLVFGFVSGQFIDQKALIHDDALFPLVSLAVAVILLEGGLSLRLNELREAGPAVGRLTSLGALVTWVSSTIAVHYLAAFSWKTAALVGAILVVTGPTVIGPLLRNVRPRKPVNAILKWEGIVIDPVGAILAVLVFGALFSHGPGHANGFAGVATGLIKTLVVGFALGIGAARTLVFVLKHHWVPGYLQSVVILAVALVLFTLSNVIQEEAGLLTVTILGIGLINQPHTPVQHIIEFKENLRIILISCLFILLAGRIEWDELQAVIPQGIALLLALILVVRPLAVFVSTAGTKLELREKLFIALMAPRGIVAAAVSAVFALELAGFGGNTALEAARIVPIVFFVIFGTCVFYGLLATPLARWLGIGVPNPQGILFAGATDPWIIDAALELKELGFRVLLVDSSYPATKKARMAGLQAINANVLSDFVSEEIDLSGIGRLLAVTPNDHVNSLACIRFSHVLGRSNVYQLRPPDLDDPDRKAHSSELTGRLFCENNVDSNTLKQRSSQGATVKCTLLTGEFTLEDYQNLNGDDSILLFIARSNGALTVMTDESPPPAPGDSLISLVMPTAAPHADNHRTDS